MNELLNLFNEISKNKDSTKRLENENYLEEIINNNIISFLNYVYEIWDNNNYDNEIKLSCLIIFSQKLLIQEKWNNFDNNIQDMIKNIIFRNMENQIKIIRDKSCKAISFIFYLNNLNNISNEEFLNSILNNLKSNDLNILFSSYTSLYYIINIINDNFISLNNNEYDLILNSIIYLISNKDLDIDCRLNGLEIFKNSINLIKNEFKNDEKRNYILNNLINFFEINFSKEEHNELIDILIELIPIIYYNLDNYLEIIFDKFILFMNNNYLINMILDYLLNLYDFEKNILFINVNLNNINYKAVLFNNLNNYLNNNWNILINNNMNDLKNILKILSYYINEIDYNILINEIKEYEYNDENEFLYLKLGLFINNNNFNNMNEIKNNIKFIILNINNIINNKSNYSIIFLIKNLIKNNIYIEESNFYNFLKLILKNGFIIETSKIIIEILKNSNNYLNLIFISDIPFYINYFIDCLNDNSITLYKLTYMIKRLINFIKHNSNILYSILDKLFNKLNNKDTKFNEEILILIYSILKDNDNNNTQIFNNNNLQNNYNILLNLMNNDINSYNQALNIMTYIYLSNKELNIDYENDIFNFLNYFLNSSTLKYEIENVILVIKNLNKVKNIKNYYSNKISIIIFDFLNNDCTEYKLINRIIELIMIYREIDWDFLKNNVINILNYIYYYFHSYFIIMNSKTTLYINKNEFDNLKINLIKLFQILILELYDDDIILKDNLNWFKSIILKLENFINEYINNNLLKKKDLEMFIKINDLSEDLKLIMTNKDQDLIFYLDENLVKEINKIYN